MAIFHWSLQVIRRGKGRSSVACAAYRAGACLRDDATGIWTDYSYRRDIRHVMILPGGVAPPPTVRPDRPHDLRSLLWNRAEAAENRRNSVVAREVNMALPRELSDDANWQLAKKFAAWVVDRYGVAVDLAMHAPDADGDQRNLHCHFLFTTRCIGPGLIFGEKTRVLDYIPTGKTEIVAMRAEWARVVNVALEAAGLSERIDHRSLADQGIDREPTKHLGPITTNRIRAAEKEIAAAQSTINRVWRDVAAMWPRMPSDIVTMDAAGLSRGWETLAANHQWSPSKDKPSTAPAVVIIDQRTLGPLGPYMAEAPVPALAWAYPPAEILAETATPFPATRSRKRPAVQAVPEPVLVAAEPVSPTAAASPPEPRPMPAAAALEAAVGDAALAEVERLNRAHAAAAEERASEEAEEAKAKKAQRRLPPPTVSPAAKVKPPAEPKKAGGKKDNPYAGLILPPLRAPTPKVEDEEEDKPKKPKAKPLAPMGSIGKTKGMARAIGRATAKGRSKGRGGRGR